MKWKFLCFVLLLVMLVVQCTQQKELSSSSQDRIRQLRPADVTSYHEPLRMEVGWVPYQEHKLVMTKKGEWKVVSNDAEDRSSTMPVILLSYPNGMDSLWLDMNIDNALLGRLLKHTLMTQVPITRPFTAYVEAAKCSKCHPKDIPIDFE